MHKGRKIPDEYKTEVAELAFEIGSAKAAERYGLPQPTVYTWLCRYTEYGKIRNRRAPDYTETEVQLMKCHADDVNCGLVNYRQLADILHGASGIRRNAGAVGTKFVALGLRLAPLSKRFVAEDTNYNPFLTVEERDAHFDKLDEEQRRIKAEQYDPLYMSLDPVAEREIDKMLGGLVARLERGDGPRVFGKVGVAA